MSYRRIPAEPPDPGILSSKRGWRNRLPRLSQRMIALVVILTILGVLLLKATVFSSKPSQVEAGPPQLAQIPFLTSDTTFAHDPINPDARPLKTVLHCLDAAEAAISLRNLSTCEDQLGRSFIDAYARSALPYCEGDSNITCLPVHHDDFSKWWPYPASVCLSTNLAPWHEYSQRYYYADCAITSEGGKLRSEMGKEYFLGSELRPEVKDCRDKVQHTLLVMQRQNVWNPFHVAEDLVTTLVTMLVAAAFRPDLLEKDLQLVFSDNFDTSNPYATLWDRMGTYAPRRLQRDPWPEGTCFADAIHSPRSGASLLSATGVAREYHCASSLTWASSLYYRHLFGLREPTRAINVLWISRAEWDKAGEAKGDFSPWQKSRELANEAEVVARIRHGLKELAEQRGLSYQEGTPANWASSDNTTVRFAAIDPTTLAMENQVAWVGHSSVLVGQHGGALGLSLFLPPGEGVLLELQVGQVWHNWHFQHMAVQMGHQYEMKQIHKRVGADDVYSSIEKWVLHQHAKL